MAPKNKRSTASKSSPTSNKEATQTDDEYLNQVLTSKKTEIPWFLSKHAMSVVVVLGIALLYLKDNGVVALYFKDNDPLSSLLSTPKDPMSQCGLVMTNSSLPDSGWGMFPLTTIPAGQPVSYGDPILQVPDIGTGQAPHITYLLHNYMWTGDVTGGMHEGRVVYSVLPGVGSLANGHPTQWNMAPPASGAAHDEAGELRSESPGAGAFTHYHNLSFRAFSNIAEGQELMVNYGQGWSDKIPNEDLGDSTKRPVEWLRKNGICLDHIQPALSNIPHAGRGAVATRFLPINTIVAPVPLLPIKSREGLMRHNGSWQLLLNYCFGHVQSSLLLVPYAPVVNLVNHGSGKEANVKMQWSTSNLFSGKHLLEQSDIFAQNDPSGLLLEFVATRDIREGDEILLDYGDAWQAAWDNHVKGFEPDSSADYEYARVWNEKVAVLRTPTELTEQPYPTNLRTTCFYKFDPTNQSPSQWISPSFEYQNLYPCRVLERNQDESYTVVIGSQESLLVDVKVPPNHIITKVPRHAIRLDDKLQSSDQHLVNAFRHEIHIPDDIFPQAWRDLV